MTKSKDSPMTQRAFRIPDDLWDEVVQKADVTGTPVAEIVRRLLRLWVQGEVDITQTSHQEKK